MDASLEKIRRAAAASVMLEWAWNPYRTAQDHAYLFNKVPDPVTEENVRQMFGDDAAKAWLACREAKAAFLHAVDATRPEDQP